jgi:hypothetical protein
VARDFVELVAHSQKEGAGWSADAPTNGRKLLVLVCLTETLATDFGERELCVAVEFGDKYRMTCLLA